MGKAFLTKESVAAIVVLYNSDRLVLENIATYINQVDKLYMVDNSDYQNIELIDYIQLNDKIEYHWLNGNLGIAAALNVGVELSEKAGYDYVLMMDDDSQLLEGTVDSMLSYLTDSRYKVTIGLIATQADANRYSPLAQSVWHCITSGSLLSLEVYQTCGPFMESLFIDGVDHEYCYRLKQFKFDIVILNYLLMPHRMGTPEKLEVFGKALYTWSSHSPVRNYYLIRNFLHILKEYRTLLPNHIKTEVYYGVLKACMIDLLLGENKFIRLKYIGKAISDFRSNKLGKIQKEF